MASDLDLNSNSEQKLNSNDDTWMDSDVELSSLSVAGGSSEFIDPSGSPGVSTSPHRYTLFPIQCPDLWRAYKECVCQFWTVDEVDLGKDLQDWEQLPDRERALLLNVLAFFASSDAIVGENIVARFSQEVPYPEAKCFYGFQTMIENIHSEMYSLLIDTYVNDPKKKDCLFRAFETMPHVKAKADWCFKWLSSTLPFAERLVAFAAVECLFFCGSFAAIFWFKRRGILPGLMFSNELISRDESMHVRFAYLLNNHLKHPATPDTVLEIIDSAVSVESQFWEKSLEDPLLGMNASLMMDYVRFVADQLLVEFGAEKYYRVKNPFDFMELISLEGKSNFFERRVGEYRSRHRALLPDFEHCEFRTDADF